MDTPETSLTVAQPLVDRRWFIRLLEIMPGAATWLFLASPFVFSIIAPVGWAVFLIAFDLLWTIKSLRLSINLIRAYGRMHASEHIDWNERLDWLRHPQTSLESMDLELSDYLQRHPKAASTLAFSRQQRSWREHYLKLRSKRAKIKELVDISTVILNPDELFNVVILATYNESLDILEPSVKALLKVDYPLSQMMLIIAYEERGGEQTQRNAEYLIQAYGHHFAYATLVEHPDGIAGEVRGKGGNITFAGRLLAKYVNEHNIDSEKVIVTTFDSDHRASRHYFTELSYAYASDPNRVHRSYQPIPMFYNNIWDAPAFARVIATGNSFWTLMETVRPHRLRNFAAHAQGLRTLIDTDFWSVATIVEDGHQFWRTYFTYEGDHQVVPVYAPVYQDAVLADSYWKTIATQYKQQRRWAWGATDISYVVRNSISHPGISWFNKMPQIWRLVESHFSWATAAFVLTFAAWVPLFLNSRFSNQVLAHQLPVITSYILDVASIGMVVTVCISAISLPARPLRYRRRRHFLMFAQWILFPVTAIVFGSAAAIEAQTRLMFGKYLDFQVTDKAAKK